MKKLTRQERVDSLLHNGFYRCGYINSDNIEKYVLHSSGLTDQLTEEFADSVRKGRKLIRIAEVRSKDFIDSDGVYYDYKGKTYQYGQFLIHIYLPREGKDGGASVLLLA